jgi:outer membrane PBP1 activator LpoA protein
MSDTSTPRTDAWWRARVRPCTAYEIMCQLERELAAANERKSEPFLSAQLAQVRKELAAAKTQFNEMAMEALSTPHDQSTECAIESLMDHGREQRIVEGRVTVV